VKFVVDKAALGQVFLRVIRFLPVDITSPKVFIYTLLFPDGLTGEIWVTFIKGSVLSQIVQLWTGKYFTLF